MKRELTAQVGPDGVLTLSIPLRQEDANKTVRIVVESAEQTATPHRPFANRDEWLQFLDETCGKWQGEFVREPEGDYEERDSL